MRIALLALSLAVATLCGCTVRESTAIPSNTPVSETSATPPVEPDPPKSPATTESVVVPEVKIPVAPKPPKPEEVGTFAVLETSMGRMKIKLHADKTPNTVANFVHLTSKGFYNGLVFHRIIARFMIQGGCPQGSGRGGPGYRFADEFHADLKHTGTGILSMANAGPGTNGSQFFITLATTRHLNGKHSVFGKVVEGMDVLKKIGAVRTARGDRPLQPVTLKTVTIFRDGKPLKGGQPAPKKLEPRRRRRF